MYNTIPKKNTYTVTMLDGEVKTILAHSFVTDKDYHTFSEYTDEKSRGVAVEAVFRVSVSLVKYVSAVIGENKLQ